MGDWNFAFVPVCWPDELCDPFWEGYSAEDALA